MFLLRWGPGQERSLNCVNAQQHWRKLSTQISPFVCYLVWGRGDSTVVKVEWKIRLREWGDQRSPGEEHRHWDQEMWNWTATMTNWSWVWKEKLRESHRPWGGFRWFEGIRRLGQAPAVLGMAAPFLNPTQALALSTLPDLACPHSVRSCHYLDVTGRREHTTLLLLYSKVVTYNCRPHSSGLWSSLGETENFPLLAFLLSYCQSSLGLLLFLPCPQEDG